MKFQSPRGFNDILPDEAFLWNFIEEKSRKVFSAYNFKEIILPVVENSDLFKRTLGNNSEVVEKQMFEIVRGDDTFALRPEGTAGVARAYLENSLDRKSPFLKLFYIGPMFRAERPQKGRLRQFNHIGAEVLGIKSPFVDAEIIVLANGILQDIGVSGYKIEINSLGSSQDKKKLCEVLRKKIQGKIATLCKDCKSRAQRNIFRVLDCKNDACRKAVKELDIKPGDYLSEESVRYFQQLKNYLDDINIKYVFNPVLVRGLDYYTGVVFEITHSGLGAQNAICAGGRYDNLVQELGGKQAGCVGFAFGLERLVIALGKAKDNIKGQRLDIYLAVIGEEALRRSFKLANDIRSSGISLEVDCEDRRLDKKISKANKLNAKFVAILGDEEIKNNELTIKNLDSGKQQRVKLNTKDIGEFLC